MAGVDKITEEILQEAQTAGDALRTEAKNKADAVIANAKEQAQQILENGRKEAEQLLSMQEERAHSSAAMRLKQAVLSAKQEVIDEVVQRAYDKLDAQDTDGYFGMVVALLKKNIHSGDGVICFSKKDLDRLPDGFSRVASKIAGEAGGTLKIDTDPAKIANGFILKYGGIEENCSLDALFAQARETLRDSVSSMLW